MLNVVIDASKYIMMLLIALYTFWNFSYLRRGEDIRHQKRISLCQNIVMFILHFLGFLILYGKTEDDRMILLYLAEVVLLAAFLWLNRLFYPERSRILVNNICVLLCVGFIILARLSFDRALRQFIIVAVSAFITLLIPLIIDHLWQLALIPWVYGVIGLALLLLVFFVGQSSYGAQISLSIGSLSFQPSEFVKISFVFFIASMLCRSTDNRTLLITTAMAAAHVIILVLCKDLGGAFIFFATTVVMLYVATSRTLVLAGGAVAGGVAAVAAYRLFSHVRTRVAAWLDPWSDIENRGYQIAQSLFAIGTGGWFGLGLCQGMPGKIPVVEKDFIFSAICEEMGGIFAVCLLLICIGCFLQFMAIASSFESPFYRLVAFGLGIEYFLQVFLAVGGAIKFIPSTGVTLPFISYGGSSMLSTFILFEVIQGLYLLERNNDGGIDEGGDEPGGEEYEDDDEIIFEEDFL